MKKISTLSIGVSLAISFASCSGGGDTPPSPPDNTVTAPDTYVFERNGKTSVSFTGQTTRILMAEEIVKALTNTSFDEAKIDAMYNHTQGSDDFVGTDPDLNASDKSVRSKTAASFDFFAGTPDVEVLKDFDGLIEDQTTIVYPAWNDTAAAGVPGKVEGAGGGKARYVNAKGLELDQMFTKSLIGALMVDQILNSYISSRVLDKFFEAANDAETLVTDKNYTDMEHDWDEAYGYLFGAVAPENYATPLNEIGPASGGSDSFLNKYLDRVNDDPDFKGIAQEIYDAFKLGRAAIVAKDYTVRDTQAEIIREKISEVIGVRAVYYLQQAKAIIENYDPNDVSKNDYAAAFHDLSEALGFIYSLQFTRQPNSDKPYLTRVEVKGIIDAIYGEKENGFWEVTGAELQTASETIAAKFTFTVEQAGS